jgi:hypothetical protein
MFNLSVGSGGRQTLHWIQGDALLLLCADGYVGANTMVALMWL